MSRFSLKKKRKEKKKKNRGLGYEHLENLRLES